MGMHPNYSILLFVQCELNIVGGSFSEKKVNLGI